MNIFHRPKHCRWQEPGLWDGKGCLHDLKLSGESTLSGLRFASFWGALQRDNLLLSESEQMFPGRRKRDTPLRAHEIRRLAAVSAKLDTYLDPARRLVYQGTADIITQNDPSLYIVLDCERLHRAIFPASRRSWGYTEIAAPDWAWWNNDHESPYVTPGYSANHEMRRVYLLDLADPRKLLEIMNEKSPLGMLIKNSLPQLHRWVFFMFHQGIKKPHPTPLYIDDTCVTRQFKI